MITLKLAELVFDTTIYPRHNVDLFHVNEIRRAIKAKTEMPPIVAERRTHRVVDGFHRGKAYIAEYGLSHEVEAVEKTYRNEKELFLDAIRYNASHGKNFDTHDKTHCIILAQQFGIDDGDLAGVLHVDPDYIGELRVDRTARVGKLSADVVGKDGSARLTVPLKRTVKDFAGRVLTRRQEEANKKLSGMNQVFYANQLIELLESKMLTLDNDKLIDRLRHLHELLGGVLAVA